MKKVKMNEIEQLEEKIINDFLEERKDWDCFNTVHDIDIMHVPAEECLVVYVRNSAGDWE